MENKYMFLILTLCFSATIFLIPKTAFLQTTDSSSIVRLNTSNKDVIKVVKKLELIQANMNKETIRVMKKIKNQEYKIIKRTPQVDSVTAANLYETSKQKYDEVRTLLGESFLNADLSLQLKSYIPGMDSLQTAIAFLQEQSFGLSNEKLSQFENISGQIQQLQAKLQAANILQSYLKDEQSILKGQLSKYGLGKEVLKINKASYYYQQRVEQLKEDMNDHNKLKQEIISEVTRQPAFQKFWQKNSILGKLFPMPDANDTSSSKIFAGLQTKAQVGKLVAERLGKQDINSKTGNESDSYLAGQVKQAKNQLDQMKDKVQKLGIKSTGSDLVIPEFNPNGQKTKTFLKRLEFGFNVQNSSAATSSTGVILLPSMSNIAVTGGYKFSDKIAAEIGIAYVLGWGAPFKEIRFSSQGIGFRGGFDAKLRGSFWISGGYEYNYLHAFAAIRSINNLNLWQKSALIGITKNYSIGHKTAKLQLLYDLLASSQIPRLSPFKYRIGYNF